MTATGVGAPLGLTLMTIGGIVSTSTAFINAGTFYGEERYGDAAWEVGVEGVSGFVGFGAGKLITPSKNLFRGFNAELGEQAASSLMGEVIAPAVEKPIKTVY